MKLRRSRLSPVLATSALLFASMVGCSAAGPGDSTASGAEALTPSPAERVAPLDNPGDSSSSGKLVAPIGQMGILDFVGNVSNIFGTVQGVSQIIQLMLQASGQIQSDTQTILQKLADLGHQLDQESGQLDWHIVELQRQARLQDAFSDVQTAAETLKAGQPFTFNSPAVNDSLQAVNEATAPAAFTRLFANGYATAPQNGVMDYILGYYVTWQQVIDDYPKQEGDGYVTNGEVFDWRLGVSDLLAKIALRLQVLAAVDPGFRTHDNAAVVAELDQDRAALQQLMMTMRKGVRCQNVHQSFTLETPPFSYYDRYWLACVDIYTGANEVHVLDATDTADLPGDLAAAEAHVRATQPIFEIQAMMDTLYYYAHGGATDLTSNYSTIHMAANEGLCLDAPFVLGGVIVSLTSCQTFAFPKAAQSWTYDRTKERIVNNYWNKCLTVDGGSPLPGTYLNVAPCDGSDPQKWTYDPWGVALTNKYGKVLDVRDSPSVGAVVWTDSPAFDDFGSAPTGNRLRNDAQRWNTPQLTIIHL